MTGGRILGLDPGERRIGVALSDALGMIASPLAVIDTHAEDLLVRLAEIIADYDIGLVVVGLPVSLRGGEGASAAAARKLGGTIAAELDVEVEYCDERFTSVQAEAALLEADVRRKDRKTVRDKVAAAIMLQGFLDRQRRAPT